MIVRGCPRYYFYGFHAGSIDYISHSNDLYENENPVYKDRYLTDILAEKAIEIINKQHSKPFFFALMFSAPHWPWQAPGDKPYLDTMPWRSGGSPAVYAAMMKSLDDATGTIMKAIDDTKSANNTVVIFTSDNGGQRFSDNGIYKEGKMSLREGGICEPAFVRWTGKIRGNSVTTQVTTTMDWTATILSLAGAKPDPKFPLDGIDIMPIISFRKKEVNRILYWRISQRKQHKAIRDGNWKYLQDEKGNEYLFDLQVDPGEQENLKNQQQAIFEDLKNKYNQWEKTVLICIPCAV